MILPGHFKCPEQSDAPQDGHAQRRHDLLAHQNKLQDGTYHNYEIKSENTPDIMMTQQREGKSDLLNRETM